MPFRQDTIEYFRLAGARTLLEPFRNGTLPGDPGEWRAALAPLIRGLANSAEEGGRNLYEIAAELRLAADLFAAAPSDPPPAVQHIPPADPADRTPAVLREIAAHVEEWNRLPESGATATTRELLLRFPRLSRILSLYFGQDGSAISDGMSDATAEEGIRMWISQVHPACPWELPGVAAECTEALALFHDEDALDRFFAQELGGGSGDADFVDFLPLLARLCIDHMKEFHPPVWQTDLRR
ncbi:hypothetical protein ACGFRG_28090 [Streptomyces sp. NPDC048696]|uniref:hypothetical protein n=1 Tax=Streptomyces sp. NPDC048696 TaxID=3365585 RepID=UPI003712EAA0